MHYANKLGRNAVFIRPALVPIKWQEGCVGDERVCMYVHVCSYWDNYAHKLKACMIHQAPESTLGR